MENLVVAEHFVNGLRKKPRVNAPFLETCFGMRCTPYGLLAPKQRAPKTVLTGESFPYPQLARLDRNVYHFGEDSVNTEAAPVAPATEGLAVPITAYTQSSGLTQRDTETVTTATTAQLLTYTLPAAGVNRVRVTVSAGAVGNLIVNTTNGIDTVTLVAAREAALGEFEFYANIDSGDELYVAGIGFIGTVTLYTAPLAANTTAGTKPYEFARFGDVWFAKNDTRLLIRSPMSRDITGSWLLYAHNLSVMPIAAICAHNNQLLLGGFDEDDAYFASSDWQYIWQNWIEFNELEMTHRDLVIGKNVVMYSRRAGGDYWSPFEVEMAMFGIPGDAVSAAATPFILDAIRKKELGFFVVPTVGTMITMRSEGDNVLIYCTDGIYAAAQGEAGWQCVRVSDHVVKVVSSEGPLTYLTQQGKLYRTTRDGLESVSENAALASLGANVTFSYDAEEQELYFTDGTTQFILTQSGLSKIDGVITSLLTVDSTLISYESGFTLGTTDCRVVTETLDFGDRFLKVVHDVALRYTSTASNYCRIHYRTTDSPTWRYSPWFLLREGGFTAPIVSGHDLRLELKFTRSTYDAQIEYANIGWRASDKRNFRLQTGGL